MRVTRNNRVLAESDNTIVVEGNHYFPPDSVNWEYFFTALVKYFSQSCGIIHSVFGQTWLTIRYHCQSSFS